MVKFNARSYITGRINAPVLDRLDSIRDRHALKLDKLPPAQPGPQQRFLDASADIVLYGGAAGGGKSWALLLDMAIASQTPGFGGVIFRRTYPQIRNEGGLWDESGKLYPSLGAQPLESRLEWQFPNKSTVRFAHLQHEKNIYDWQGAQLPRIGFDELTHFTRKQFFYLLSRARTTLQITPQIRATCNPDADSWVAEFISWWIDQDTGLAIPERSGVVRYFIELNGETIWSDRPGELEQKHPGIQAKSFTFIPSKITDNKILLDADPGYLANLMAQHPVERARLLDGNWRVRDEAGKVINRDWFPTTAIAPDMSSVVRFWDFAGTEKQLKGNDPDWTIGVKMGRGIDGKFYLLDVVRLRANPGEVERMVLAIAHGDGQEVMVRWEREPGSAGKFVANTLISKLAGFDAKSIRPQGDKLTRARPFAAQAEAGNVLILQGCRNLPAYLSVLHAFPDGTHDDDVDASSGAFNELSKPKTRSPVPQSRVNW